jgi:uncharacterized protein YbaR (Trm112 family)
MHGGLVRPSDPCSAVEVFGTEVERPVAPRDLKAEPRDGGAMKRDLMDILCCPVCKGDLELQVNLEKDEILEGFLFCKTCNHRYEIRDGIPDLLPPDFK